MTRRRTKAGDTAETGDASSVMVSGGLHEGRMILLAAERYRGVFRSSLEAVQNGFDAGATRVAVVVDLRDQQAYIADNGTGADQKRMETALLNVGISTKDEPDALGQWGIGFVSPTMACKTYSFTSWASTDGVVRRLTFREAALREMRKFHIPMETVDELTPLPAWAAEHLDGEFAAQWRTVVHMDELKPDRTTSAFDTEEFRRIVRSRFSRVMRNRGALVRLIFVGRKARRDRKPLVVDIDPTVYHGESLGEVPYHHKDTGEVTFRLWVAPEDAKGNYHGEVDVLKANDNTTVSILEFSRQALVPGKHVTPRLREAMTALKSGRFAGEITCDNLELHVERSGFVTNDALMALFGVIVQWYDDHGYIYYEVGREESREQRWKVAGVESQAMLSRLLSQARYAELRDSVATVLGGASKADKGEATAPPSRPDEPGAKAKEPKKAADPKPESTNEDEPKGSRHKVSLNLAHAPSRSRRFWSFSFEAAELTINTGHEVWGQLDETNGRHEARNARWIREFQHWLQLQVLVLLSRYPNPHEFEQHRAVLDDMVPLYADMMVQRDSRKRQDTDDSNGATA